MGKLICFLKSTINFIAEYLCLAQTLWLSSKPKCLADYGASPCRCLIDPTNSIFHLGKNDLFFLHLTILKQPSYCYQGRNHEHILVISDWPCSFTVLLNSNLHPEKRVCVYQLLIKYWIGMGRHCHLTPPLSLPELTISHCLPELFQLFALLLSPVISRVQIFLTLLYLRGFENIDWAMLFPDETFQWIPVASSWNVNSLVRAPSSPRLLPALQNSFRFT
jgi:hypothetical protein